MKVASSQRFSRPLRQKLHTLQVLASHPIPARSPTDQPSHAAPDFDDAAHDLMARHDGQSPGREVSCRDPEVGSADRAGRHGDDELTVARVKLASLLPAKGSVCDRRGTAEHLDLHELNCSSAPGRPTAEVGAEFGLLTPA